MKTTYTRIMAIMAFLYSLYYIETTETVNDSVLIFIGCIIAIWALGRATIIEAIKIWKGDD